MKFKKIILSICMFLIVISFFEISYAESSYIWSDTSNIASIETSNKNTTDLKLESGGAILIEKTTGTVLYEHNAHEIFRPASVTKVMSLLLIMEALDSRSNSIKR